MVGRFAPGSRLPVGNGRHSFQPRIRLDGRTVSADQRIELAWLGVVHRFDRPGSGVTGTNRGVGDVLVGRA